MSSERRVTAPFAAVRETPDAEALRGKFESQLVFGEVFVVEEEEDGWCRGHCMHDGYKGHVEAQHLSPLPARPTHIVTAARSDLYRDPSVRAPRRMTLGFGSLVTVEEVGEQMSRLDDGNWIFGGHLAPVDTKDTDIVTTALKFVETPYLWGGRSGFGIDCSGLVQVCLSRAGVAVERDTEQQMDTVGIAADTRRRGDIVYFLNPGHVGIMVDDTCIVHATGFFMKTVIEPLDEVKKRYTEMAAIRRIWV